MASDDEKKKTPNANIFGLEDDAWDDALEQWGDHLPLEVPTGPAPAATAAEDAPAAAAEGEGEDVTIVAAEPPAGQEAGGDVDPMVALVADGEIEFDDGAPAALGSLLGAEAAPFGEVSTYEEDALTDRRGDFFEEDAVTDKRAPSTLPVAIVEAEEPVEEEGAIEVPALEPIFDDPAETTEPIARGALPQEEFDDALTTVQAAEEEPPALPEDLDEGDDEGDDEPTTVRAVGTEEAPQEDERESRTTLPRGVPSALSLSAIDDLVPITMEQAAHAGEVLPAPTPAPLPPSAPSIFDEIDLDVEEEQSAELPRPDAALLEIKLGGAAFADGVEAPPAADAELWLGALDAAVDAADSTRKAARLALCAASVAEASGRHEEALERYKDVLNHQSGYVVALQALQRLYRQGEDRVGEAELIGQLARTIGGKLGKRLQAQRADHLWLHGGDDEGARAALAESGDDLRASLVLVDLSTVAGDVKAQADALRSLAGSLEDDGMLAGAVHVTRARLLEDDGDIRGASSAYGAATEANEACRAAWEGLSRTARVLGDHQRYAAAIEGGSSLLGSWQGRVLRRRAALIAHGLVEGDAQAEFERARELDERSEPTILAGLCEHLRNNAAEEGIDAHVELADASEQKAEKVHALVSAAALAETRGKIDRAVELYGRAVEVDESCLLAARAVARLRGEDSDPQRQLVAYRAAAEVAPPIQAAAFHLRAASILRRELGDEAGAVEEYRAALRADPGCVAALGGLSAALGASGQQEVLAKTLRELAGETEDVLRAVSFACRAASIEEERNEPDGAVAALELALERDGAAWLPRRRLARLLSVRGRHDELAARLEVEIEDAEGARRALLMTRRAELKALERHWDEAVIAYRQASADEAALDRSRWGVVRLAGRVEAWKQVADQIEQMCELRAAEGADAQEQTLLLRLAALRAGPLADLEGAIDALERAGAGASTPEGAAVALRRVQRWLGDKGHVAEDLRQRLESSSDDAEKRALLVRLAEHAAEVGAERDEVVQLLRDALALDAADPIAGIGLQEVFLDAGQWQAFEDAVLAQLGKAEDARFEGARYDEMTELAFSRGDSGAATRWLEALLALQPEAVAPLRRRGLGLTGEGRLRDLLPIAQREAQAATVAKDRFALFCEFGRSLGRIPVSPESTDTEVMAASEAWAGALEALPGSRVAGRALVREARASNDSELLADTYLRCADATDDAESAASWRVAAAEAMGTDATELLAAAVAAVPADLAAIYAWRDRELLAGRWEAALEAVEAEAKVVRGEERKVRAHLLAGVIAAERLQQNDRAASHFQEALEVDPRHEPAFDRLMNILEEGELWADLVQALKTRLAGVDDVVGKSALHRRIALVARERLDDWDLAQEQLEALLELTPEDAETLDAAADVYEHQKAWSQAADALIRRARLERRKEKLRDYLLRLGRIYQDEEPDHQRAILSFNKALTLDPDNKEALQRLSDLYMDDLQFEAALGATERLLALERDTERQVDHLLRIGKLYEDGLKDGHRAAQALRRANELAPADLRAIGALCGFYARQGDQRSVMIHLDRAQTSMRLRLEQDPFEEFAYRALFKIFGWRKNPDGGLCAAEVLQLLGHLNGEERQFIERHASGVGAAGDALAADEHDEWLFRQDIPSGFRHLFRLLAEPLSRLRRGDLRGHGVGRGDKLGTGHPVRGIGDQLAREIGVSAYDLFISQTEPHAVVVENTSPPAVILGKVLIEGASEQEVTFLLGRCLWIIRKAMVLPARFPEDVEALVAGVVRQYVPEFEPPGVDARLLADITKQVGRVIPRKMKQELMPFALECSGEAEAIGGLGPAVIHSANRAGLLACRSVEGAVSALRRAAGRSEAPRTKEQRTSVLLDNPEAEELLRFAVSDAHFELRRAMNIAIR